MPSTDSSHFGTAADWAERETYDMFGIPFEGHPELTRIYMPQDYDGWPMSRRTSRFKGISDLLTRGLGRGALACPTCLQGHAVGTT